MNPSILEKITCTPVAADERQRILIAFDYDKEIIREVKKLPGRKWSATLKVWHVPDTNETRGLLGLARKGERETNDRKSNRPEPAPVRTPAPGPDAVGSNRDRSRKPPAAVISEVNKPALAALKNKLTLKAYSKNTCRTYRYEFSRLLCLLGEYPVDEMDIQRIESYFLYCAEKLKMSESRINSRYNAVKFYFEQVLGRKKFFVDLPRPKAPAKLPKHIGARDIRKLFAAVTNPKHALMLKLCYGMGLRVSEIVALKVKDIDSGNMQVLIEAAKGKKDRYVNLPESILDELRAYYRTYKPAKYLFEGQGGGKYSVRSAQHVFKSAMEKAKINKDVGIHGLRHSFATHLLENGTDVSYIQQLLGHNDVKTTMIYAKVAKKDLKRIKSPLDDLWGVDK